MRYVIIEGISSYGKDRCAERGDHWLFIKEQNSVPFSDKVGPWWLVESLDEIKYLLWFHITNDEHHRMIVSFEED